MKNKINLVVIAILVILALTISVYIYKYSSFASSFVSSTNSLPDTKAQEVFKMRDYYNNPIESVKTDYVIFNFWASWCPPCVEETPSLIQFTEKHSDKFTLFAISQDSSIKDIEKFLKIFPGLKSKHITLIHDDSQSVARLFNVVKLPETFVYSVKQNKFFQVSGLTNWEHEDVLKTLSKVFNEKF